MKFAHKINTLNWAQANQRRAYVSDKFCINEHDWYLLDKYAGLSHMTK